MPRRTDISSVLIIGSGPIVIGQACEFDYSGTQACKALREEGIRVILVNSNPATIMTDPETADVTYIEPLTVEVLDQILAEEKPDAILPTLGGQTALNLAVAATKAGVLSKHGVELIGADIDVIDKAEDRARFKESMTKIGLATPRSKQVSSLVEARAVSKEIGFPAILRPSFTMGGSGGAIAYNAEEFDRLVLWGLDQSPTRRLLIEQSVLGWKEFELEVMRDKNDNVVIICSIENFDPMGIHTGDSITVAPAMTLTDREYQRMRDDALAVIREIGVETGGSNIQFAINPANGEQIVIEMNPRVSRSSALASKATGFPIAKIAAKLAIGYSLDEISNDITRETPASFEPSIDYVVVKAPRFAFEKFPAAKAVLGTQMKSVGEAMAIGRTFREALGKAVRSLETGRQGFDERDENDLELLAQRISVPGPERIFDVVHAMRLGMDRHRVHELTAIDPWFLAELEAIVDTESAVASVKSKDELEEHLFRAKRDGISDERIASLANMDLEEVRQLRAARAIRPVFKRVDTCAAEFRADTPYMYSTYERECEASPSDKEKVIVLGGGPNRIGQGIEFDYCCVHAVQALKADGYETIMINCNPETVSTDYDTADRLYFEPLTLEDVLAICELEKPTGIIVQYGGQTPLKLALPLANAGVPILGTSADAIDRAEDRDRFVKLLEDLELRAPRSGIARTLDEVDAIVESIGYPVMVRPSYVLGGRAMERVYNDDALARYLRQLADSAGELDPRSGGKNAGFPLLIDELLVDAIEFDIDLIADHTGAVAIGGIMEHIEEAGIHSGDSACSLPPYSLATETRETMKSAAIAIARELGVVGLMNMQVAVSAGEVYILEVNPRASRTIPFVSKAIGQPLAKIAARVMAGKTLADIGFQEVVPPHVAVKESVFPFIKFEGADTILGPEMRSTGEVMGIDRDFPRAFGKAQTAAGNLLPHEGTAFISVRKADKEGATEVAKALIALGFGLTATAGTAAALRAQGLEVATINKAKEGRPHCVDAIINGDFAMVINTTSSEEQAIRDSHSLRRAALTCGICYFTTLRAAEAAVAAIAAMRDGLQARPLQTYHQEHA